MSWRNESSVTRIWNRKLNNQLFEEIQAVIHESEKSISELQSKNEELLSYIEKIENSENWYAGKDNSEVKKKSRTLNAFMCRAKTALWFGKSFGIELESLTVSEPKTGVSHTLMTEAVENCNGSDSLSEEEKSRVEKFCFYWINFVLVTTFI